MEQDRAQRILNLFEVYLKSERANPDTIKTYVAAARRFLDVADNLNEESFRAFQANNYALKNNTALRNYYALKALFASQNAAFKVKAPPAENQPRRPMINPDDMKRLILAIKAGGNSTERGLLALSSTYGLRRKEMMLLNRADIDYNNKTITVRSVKRGRERVHLIPDCVFGFITNYDFKLRNNVDFAELFWSCINQAGISAPAGSGWHSIRRALYTGLKQNGLDYAYRFEFMRWRIRELTLDQTYGQTSPADIDREAFLKHPFLKWWE